MTSTNLNPDATMKAMKRAAWGDSPFVALPNWMHDRLRRRLEYLDAIEALTPVAGTLVQVLAVEDVNRAAQALRYAELNAAADAIFGARS
jgi:hypothetical protein